MSSTEESVVPKRKPWYRRWWAITGGVLLLIIVITNISGGSSQNVGSVSQPTASPPKAAAKAAGIGSAVRDGKFEFTVAKVETGKGRIGTSDFGKSPQGQFVFVYVTVKNIGDEPQSLFGDNQYLYVGNKKYSADTEAAIYLDNSKSLYEEINPGNALKGVVIFDVPKGAKPTKLEMHDSAFSGGVDVNLA